MLENDLHGDTGVLVLVPPCRMCVFNVHIVETDAEYYDGKHPPKILSQHNRQQK